ncbi:MAG: S9 family peptidase [Bryobacteraceae bacterium]
MLITAASASAQKKPVTIDAVTGRQGAGRAGEITWAPDGRRFAYPQDRRIWLYDVISRSRRELVALAALEAAAQRAPQPALFDWENRRVREQRIQWTPDGQSLLLKAGGDLFLYRLQEGNWVQLTKTPEDEKDPKLSPDGSRVSFRRGNDLYVIEIASRRLTRLTKDGSETRWNARLDWVYPEELDLGTAHWWSPDAKRIAYLQFDVSRQPLYPHADLLPLRPVYEPQRYPKAGEPNAEVRLGVVAAAGGSTRWMRLNETQDALLARVKWAPDGRALFVQKLNRIQNRLDLLAVDPFRGDARQVLREEDPYWVNVADILEFLKGGAEFLWSSERDGYRHLYRYSIAGQLLARLTSGHWEVTALTGVDEPRGFVYYVSTEASPLERHLYRVALDGGERLRLSQEPGTHSISMGPGCGYYLAQHSSSMSPPRRTLWTSDGAEWAVFEEPDRRAQDEFDLLPEEFLEVRTPDGATLHASLIRPAGFQAGRRYPAVVFVYGGPHSQLVQIRWQGLTLEQALAHRGYVIWKLDNRGMAGRGHVFETPLFRRFGRQELEDQKAGVQHLLSLGFVDPARVGIYGWSYGGYMTLYAMLNAPEIFQAGVAGAPVTDWRNYDTIYTERYLGLPSENEQGYRLSSVVHQAANLRGSLLLVHNLEDDNVLFQNTLQMANALQSAGKPFEMMVYPLKSHGVSGTAREHMLKLIADFFDRRLKPAP